MKLGVAYIVFDGVELLEHSIRQIRPHVNHITVIYQNQSWFGKPILHEDKILLQSLLKNRLIDELSCFTAFTPLKGKDPQSILKSKSFERAKRQFGLSISLAKGCTHYLCMDVDEFYESSQFLDAKNEIIKNGYDLTAVRYINYVNTPTIHRGYDSARVPFICKISPSSKMGASFFVKCDPTRGIVNGSTKKHEFAPIQITMHHMETVRKNLFLKYDSTTRGIFKRERTADLVNSIKSVNEKSQTFDFKKIIFPGMGTAKLIHCENIFGIPYESWK